MSAKEAFEQRKTLLETEIDEEKCQQVEDEILDALNESQLNLKELLYVLAHTIVDIGGSLERINGMIDANTARRRFAESPTIGNALLNMGLDILIEWLGESPDNSS